ncbi:Stemmadenine O-acetyltransferase [Linum perenne]
MEVSIISVDKIKPFSSTKDLKQFKLSMLDQIMPCSYTPLIHFYPNHDRRSVSAKLKSSLSKTLNPFYPLSGRLNDANTIVHDFDEGVPFTEARVRGQSLVDFLRPPKLELLHRLLPVEPFAIANSSDDGPQVAVQLNTFDCGAIALGLSFSHKLIDGATLGKFLKTWAANSRPNVNAANSPALDFVSGSSIFPPLLQQHDDDDNNDKDNDDDEEEEQMTRHRTSTRRFVFDNEAISALRLSTRSPKVEYPSRAEALSAFVWKHAMRAASSAAVPGSPRLQSFTLPINMRSLDGRLSPRSVGNLVYPLLVSCEDLDEKKMVSVIRKGIAGIDGSDFSPASVPGQFAALAGVIQQEQQLLVSSNWTGFGFNNFEFGLGEPVWTAVAGDADENSTHAFARDSLVVLKEAGARRSRNNNGIEAWITLRRDVMAVFESDPEFLKFASPNPPISFE